MAEFILRKEGDDETRYKIEAPDLATAAGMLANGVLEKTDRGTFALPEPPLSALQKMGEGAMDPLYGLQQFHAHTFGTPQEAIDFDNKIKQREADLKARGMQEGDWSRAGGRMAAAIPVAAATGGMGLPGAIAGGALLEAANPVMDEQDGYWTQKGEQAAVGGAAALGGTAAGKAVGTVISPKLRADARRLVNAGVDLTLGRMAGKAGGWIQRAEDAFGSFPFLGAFIRGAQGRSIESYNTAHINQALEPIGARLGANVPAGHEAVRAATDAADNFYNNILNNPNLRLPPTIWPHLENEIQQTSQLASSLPPHGQGQQFQQILHNHVWRDLEPLTQGQSISGRQVKDLDAQLRYFVDAYRGSRDPSDRIMARYLDDVRSSVRDALAATNPTEAAALKRADYTWAMLTRIQDAAQRRVGSEGVFSPTDMLYAIRKQDKTVRHNAFAQGDALMQDFAEVAHRLLPSRLPDSGTAERHLYTHIPKALAGGAGALGLAKTAIATGAASLPYTSGGQSLMNMAARSGPLSTLADYVRTASPYIGTMAEPLTHNLFADTSEPYQPAQKKDARNRLWRSASPSSGRNMARGVASRDKVRGK